MKKTTQLKNLLNSTNLEFIMEAHNALSAKIVEEAGFKGIWGSGLSISAALGVRDSNEASWTQILEVLEFMSDATTIPILLDGDTGYGNFNNVRRLIRKLEQRQIAGVCIEDKLFPKTNSFISSEKQPLADVEEFCGKIKAAKDTQQDNDFVVVARIEALIAGWGISEAIRRAEEYKKAGADAILIHSKKTDVSEIDAFMREWRDRCPVIIVPTKYYSTPTEKFKDLKISMVIWANHTIRSSISAMQRITNQIFNDESLINAEEKIVPVAEVFRLQGADELKEAENKYLSAAGKKVNAIVLAASQGDQLGTLTEEIPKTLLKVNGRTILETQIDSFNQMGIKDISVVRGFAKNKIKGFNITTIDNDDFSHTKELFSLYIAKEELKENTLIVYGDILFKNYILHDLMNDHNDIAIIVDADYEENKRLCNDYRDYVKTDNKYSRKTFLDTVKLEKMSTNLKKDEITGEFIGLWKINHTGAKVVKKTLHEMSNMPGFKQMRISDLFNEIQKVHPIAVKFIRGSWLDIDTIADLQKSGRRKMINTRLFGQELKKNGFDFYSGVPCSHLKYLINYAINECEYIIANNEGEAVAICAGAHIGGRKSVFFCQNSGLTNASSPLTSLNYIFNIPVLGIMSQRGEQGIPDEPQHELMGEITTKMLELMQIKWEYLSNDFNEAKDQIQKANEHIKNNQTFFFIVRKGIFEKEALFKKETKERVLAKTIILKTKTDTFPKRIEVLKKANDIKDNNTVLLATTGKTGRELYEVEDARNNLYMVGSMGCISSFGLGIALANKRKDIIAIDGDGSLLMRMGTLATNAYYSPENMLHIVLDNNSYDSTGGQLTVSQNVNFVEIAASAGYPISIYAHDVNELGEYINCWKKNKGLTFLYIKISKGSKEDLGRPGIKPFQVKERLMQFLREGCND